MLIVQVEPPQNVDGGDYYYRTHAPGIAMAHQEGVYVINLTSQHRCAFKIMAEADVLILNDVCHPDLLPLIESRKSNGRLTVYEIGDDLQALQPWNPVYEFYKNSENVMLSLRLASICDALQVTCHELKKIYGSISDVCQVFPNQILHVPPERVSRVSGEIVIGWGGSHGHLEDLADISAPLIKWIHRQPDTVLHLMCSDPIWELFGALPPNKKQRTAPGSFEKYFDFLSGIDIGIGLLKNTAYNRSRSDVKFLEYAVSGAVPVMRRLAPYIDSVSHGETGYLYDSASELLTILDRLTTDPNTLKRVRGKARKYVKHHRLQIPHGSNRTVFYENRLRQLSQNPPKGSGGSGRFEKWSRLEGSIRRNRHLRLTPTRFESLLHDGLVRIHQGEPKEARRLLAEAKSLMPQNYLPYMFGAAISENPIDCLNHAIERHPGSIKSWVMLGEEHARRGHIREAFESFNRAAEIFADYDIPYLRAAGLLKKIGDDSQARKLSEKAARLQIGCPPITF